jgi:hypothetical protein
MKSSCVVPLLAGLLVGSAAAFAQQSDCPNAARLDPLRGGRPGASDDAAFDEWIQAALGNLQAAGSAAAAQTIAADRFVECFAEMFNNAANGVDFKAKFADRTAAFFQPELARQGDLPVYQARALAGALLALSSERTREVMLQGLTFPDQAVRYLSARGLAAIREQVAVDKIKTDATLRAIAAAGANESSAIVAQAIYQALSYPGEHAETSGRAIMQMLTGRVAALREARGDIGRAEAIALRYLSTLLDGNRFGAEARTELVRQLATLLRLAAERISRPNLSEMEREGILTTIEETEAILKRIVNPSKAPDMSGKLASGDAASMTEMQIELIGWIGSEQEEGVLSAAPWSVPRGAP